jgi:hypothetical protein
MDKWEQRLSSAHPAQPFIAAHQDRLRQQLRDEAGRPHRSHKRTWLACTVIVVGLLSGATIIRPSWASELIRVVFVGERKLTAADGTKFTVRTFTAEANENVPSGTPVQVSVTDDGHNATAQAQVGADPELEQMHQEAAQSVQNGRAELYLRDGQMNWYKVTLRDGRRIIYTVGPGESWSITKLD